VSVGPPAKAWAIDIHCPAVRAGDAKVRRLERASLRDYETELERVSFDGGW